MWVVGGGGKNPYWYFIIKMKIADSVSGRKALADKNDNY
jgi:hypothetical protein